MMIPVVIQMLWNGGSLYINISTFILLSNVHKTLKMVKFSRRSRHSQIKPLTLTIQPCRIPGCVVLVFTE